jgi:succinate dehydrogenase/fumarate reductase flavoprotein subunit
MGAVLSLLPDSAVSPAPAATSGEGHFMVWPAKAVVLATGDIGPAFKITSNS